MATLDNATTKPERELVDRLSRGSESDHRIAASLVDTYYPVLLRYAHAAGIPNLEVEDVIEDAFIDAYRYLQHHSAVATFRATLLNTFRRRVKERFNRNIDSVSIDDVTETLDSPSLGLLDVGTVREAFDKILSEDESRVLLLRYAEGQSNKEIARALGVSTETVRLRAERAMSKLQEFLTERAASRK